MGQLDLANQAYSVAYLARSLGSLGQEIRNMDQNLMSHRVLGFKLGQ